MSRFKSYTFEVGGIRHVLDGPNLSGKLSRYRIVQGTTQEISMIAAYRKVTGDHATILCRGDTYAKIVDPDGKSVTVITQRSKD